MRSYKWIFAFFCIFCIPLYSYSASLIIHPGIIIDDNHLNSKSLIENLKKELDTLLPGQVQFSDRFILSSEWSLQKARANYDYLVKHPDINLIISFGILSSGAVVEKKKFPKPVIAVGIIDPEIQGLNVPVNNRSDVHNFTYLLFNQSLNRDLAAFYEIYPYKSVGIIADKNIIDAVIRNPKPIKKMMDERKSSVNFIGLQNSIEEALPPRGHFDAVYISHLGRFEGEEKTRLITLLMEQNIPSFGASLKDIESGALAALSPEESLTKIIRRIALNIESLVGGENFSTLPVNLKFEEKLTINIRAAKKIGFSPKFSVLAKADVVNELSDTETTTLSYSEAITEALFKNIDLKISQFDVDLAIEDLRLSKSGYYPSFFANATQTMIDGDRAQQSRGQQAEHTTSGNVKIEQILFSEDLNSGIEVSSKTVAAVTESHLANRLDIVYNATEAYFNVLKAKTLARIRKKDIKLTQKHLSIARQRQLVGYSGLSDVYRWQSSIATATSSLFESVNSYKLSKINLNKLLNRPLGEDISIKDESLTGDLFKRYTHIKEYEYIDNPATFHKFANFLVTEAMLHSPEIKKLESNMAALERQLLNYKRKRYLPVASLSGDATHTFKRNGEGSNVPGSTVKDNQWTVAVNLSWPIYTGGSIGINMTKIQKDIQKLQKLKIQLTQNLELNVRSAILEVVNNLINLESSEKSAGYAQKNLELIEDSYAAGKVSITELIDAQNDGLTTRLGALTSAYEYLLSIFYLERTTGRFSLLSNKQEQMQYFTRMKTFMALKESL